MKKIKLVIAAACVLISFNSMALAGFEFGAKGGLNLNKLNASGVTSDTRMGPVAGLWVRLHAVSFFVQADLVYAGRGGQFSTPAVPPLIAAKTVKLTSGYLEMPVMVGKRFFKVLRLNAGPNFQYLLSAKQDGKDVKSGMNGFVIGYQAGLGVDISKFGADVRYDGNLSKFTSSSLGYPSSTRASVIQVTFSYRFVNKGV
ncbi:MAG: PorT family protein [Bacteroidia bacterium]|nr:PorT family protein [Bacteroidia bacterium]